MTSDLRAQIYGLIGWNKNKLEGTAAMKLKDLRLKPVFSTQLIRYVKENYCLHLRSSPCHSSSIILSRKKYESPSLIPMEVAENCFEYSVVLRPFPGRIFFHAKSPCLLLFHINGARGRQKVFLILRLLRCWSVHFRKRYYYIVAWLVCYFMPSSMQIKPWNKFEVIYLFGYLS